MVSWTGHIFPVFVTVAVWFLATGLIAWLDNLQRKTFPISLVLSGILGLSGLISIFIAMAYATVWAVYLSFLGALMVWSWLEIAFLTGAATGPRKQELSPGTTGWQRFSEASSTVIHHEIVLVLSALMLLSITWGAANQIGAMTFVLLYILRLSAKLNIFVGVPNSATDILPAHLSYLKTYYGPKRLNPALLVSIALICVGALWVGGRAIDAPAGSPDAVGASLLFALAMLGAIEHLFLALPFRDGILWGWALPKKVILEEEL